MSVVTGASRKADATNLATREAAATPNATIPSGRLGAPPTAAAAPDAMAGATLSQAPQLNAPEAGLQTRGAENPFQRLVQAGSVVGSESLRLSRAGVGLEQEVMPSDRALGKLSSLGFRAAGSRDASRPQSHGLQRASAKLHEGSMLLVADAVDGAGDDADSPLNGVRAHLAGVVIANPKGQNLGQQVGDHVFAHKSAFPLGMDVNAFVQQVLREAYLLDGELLMDQARKLDALNRWKKKALKKKRRVEELRLKVKHDWPNPSEEDLEELGRLLDFEPDGEVPAERDPNAGGNEGDQESGTPPGSDGAGDSQSSGEGDTEQGLSLEENGLTAEVNALLDGRVRVYPSIAGYDPEPLRALLGRTPEETSNAIAAWFGERAGSPYGGSEEPDEGLANEFKDLMAGARALGPDEFAKLFRGLLQAKIRAEGARQTWRDDDGFDARYHEILQELGGRGHYAFPSALKRLLKWATPAQLAALGSPDTHQRNALQTLGGFRFQDEIVDANELLGRSRAVVADNPFPPGSHEREVFDLFQRLSIRRVGADDFLAELSVTSVEAAANVLERILPPPLTTGLSLEELLGVLPKGHLEGENLAHFAFLNDLELDTDDPLITRQDILAAAGGSRPGAERSNTRIEAEPSLGAERLRGFGESGVNLRNVYARLTATEDPTAAPPPPTEESRSSPSADDSASSDDTLDFDALYAESLGIDFNDGKEPYVLAYATMTEEEIDEFFDNRIGKIDDAIETHGFDMSQLQLEIQNLQQKRQQMLSMMSNLSKMIHDTVMSIIRNIGG